MKNLKKFTALAIIGSILLVACKRSSSKDLNVVGSDTMVQLAQNLAANFMKKNKTKKVAIRGGGSGTGIAALLNSSTHIANASRKIKQKELDKAKKLGIDIKEYIVGLDGVAVLVNIENKVSKLTIAQLSDIYSGKIENWQDVGGADAQIVVISRENNSGTHVYFKEEVLRKGDKKSTLEFGPKTVYAVSSQQIIDQTKGNANAIGYVGMGWVIPAVKALKVSAKGSNFYAPSVDNVKSDRYPIARTLQMYVNQKYKEMAAPFISFTLSEEGQRVVAKLGFVPVQ